MSGGVAELKARLLELLESDAEFRYAVAAKIGLLEILERLERHEERMARLEERMVKLEERMLKLEERVLKLEERMEEHSRVIAEHSKAIRELQEQVKILQEQVRKLQEQMVSLQEQVRELQKQMVRLQEQVVKLQEQVLEHSRAIRSLQEQVAYHSRVLEEHTRAIRELQRLVNVVAHRFGVVSEAGLREALRGVVEEVLGVATVTKMSVWDEKGIVYGYSCEVDIDVVVRDREHVIVEVKSRVDPGDVRIAVLKARLYEEVFGVKPRVVIVGGFIHPRAREAAEKLGVEVKPAVETA